MHERKIRRKYETITVHRLKGMGHSPSAFDQSALFMYFMFTEENILTLFLNFNFEKIKIYDHPLEKI